MIGLIFVDIGNKPTEPLEQIEVSQDYAYHIEDILSMRREGDANANNILNVQLDCKHSTGILLWYIQKMLVVSCAECKEVAGRFMIASREK